MANLLRCNLGGNIILLKSQMAAIRKHQVSVDNSKIRDNLIFFYKVSQGCITLEYVKLSINS